MSSAITLRTLTGSKNCLQNGPQSEILAPLRVRKRRKTQGFTVLTDTSDLGRLDGVNEVLRVAKSFRKREIDCSMRRRTMRKPPVINITKWNVGCTNVGVNLAAGKVEL